VTSCSPTSTSHSTSTPAAATRPEEPSRAPGDPLEVEFGVDERRQIADRAVGLWFRVSGAGVWRGVDQIWGSVVRVSGLGGLGLGTQTHAAIWHT
jgi:hypothetical protein